MNRSFPNPLPPSPSSVPLAVDLDGTLIRTDMMWESLARLLRRNPFALFQVLWWWSRGRPRLKQELGARVQIDPATLPYHQPFLAWLRTEQKAGRKIILATASDIRMARPIADHVGLFDDVLASDGQTNLRDRAKLRALTEKFGERGFDYAGNSTADFAVWRGSHAAVVVNASPAVRAEAGRCTRLGPVFCEGWSPVAIPQRIALELFWRSGYLLALLAGLLLASAFPGLNLAGFAWAAPALLLFAARGQTDGDSFRTGYVGGLIFWLAALYWLLLIPVTGFPILGWLALSAYLGLYSGVWVWFLNRTQARSGQHDSWSARTLWALGGAAAWVALELLRGWLFTGFPWIFLGVSQYRLVPLIQVASLTGVYGVSFLIIWFSLSLYTAALKIWRDPNRKFVWQAEIALPLLTVMGLFLWGFFTASYAAPATPNTARVTLVQPSVPIQLIWNNTLESDARRFQNLLQQSGQALTNSADLLVWPESGIPDLDDGTYHAISHFAQAHHVSLVFNSDDVLIEDGQTNYYNAALLMDPDGQILQVYHKRALVAFGEYIPLVRWLPFIQWFTPISGGWTPGKQPVQFDVPLAAAAAAATDKVITLGGPDNAPAPAPRTHFRAAPLICFEDVFPSLGRSSTDDDTDFLVNLTNDGWFGHGAEQWQHAAAAVFRAVENGRPLVRDCNNGITCLIDSHGRVTQLLTDATGDVHGPGNLTVDVPLLDHPTHTYYHEHGDWFAWSCVVLSLLALTRTTLGTKRPV